jgi:hypothetical protein
MQMNKTNNNNKKRHVSIMTISLYWRLQQPKQLAMRQQPKKKNLQLT